MKWLEIAHISIIIWFLCVIVCVVIAVLFPNNFNPKLGGFWPRFGLSSIVILGVVSFLLVCFSFAFHYSFVVPKEKNILLKIIRFILSLVFLPFVIMRNILDSLFGLFILLPIWGFSIILSLIIFGVITSSTPVTGTSMMPTIHDKENVDLFSFTFIQKFFDPPQKGDIVTFSSDKTISANGENVSYIKRVVATRGDELTIKDGFLYVNNQIVQESYTAKPRSTFGGSFLPDCKSIKVPDDYVFVLGDNRKRSKDSREIGLVSINSIDNILPVHKQSQFQDRIRDTSNDTKNLGLPSFDLTDYYQQINQIRIDNKLNTLKRSQKLETAALARAKSIVENNEIDKVGDKDKSKYPYAKAIQDAGYSNIVTGEIRTSGYYDAQELSDYWLEYETKKNLLDKQFQDTGIAAYVGKIDGCEVQVIVQEFGGYIPPSYSKSDLQSWRDIINNLNEVIPSWEKAKGWGNINQDDLNKLLDLLYKQKTIAVNILSKMEANKWLTDQENQSINTYNSLIDQSSNLADKLNSH